MSRYRIIEKHFLGSNEIWNRMESMQSIEEPKNSIVLISISFKVPLNANQALEKETTLKVVIEKDEENAYDFN